ncbi:MAG: hypothetical protein AMS18_06350 [Gemmatimonas sp. SG8_17]|nr:MAG: hypothetical protein AMS18_06350 [Gemmatimonas sp. SG8_17]
MRNHLRNRQPRRIVESDTVEAAVAIVLSAGGAGGTAVLLIRRAENERDPWSGQMALPGGRREPDDSSLLQTSCRETHEETGVVLLEQTLLGELDDLHPRTPTLPPIVVRPFVFGLKERPAVRTNEEVTLHLWAPLESLRAGATISRVETRGGHSLEVPSYVLGTHVIWGITERILKPIIDLAG